MNGWKDDSKTAPFDTPSAPTVFTVGYLPYSTFDRRRVFCVVMAGILLVDDNPNIRHLLRVYVETQTSFKICGEAGHGVDAIEKARGLQPDLVLLDLSMPVLGGAEAASVLKAMLPRTKIILFSMHLNDIPKALASAIGVDLALSKSDGITRLGDHLKSLLTPKGVDDPANLEAGSKANSSIPV